MARPNTRLPVPRWRVKEGLEKALWSPQSNACLLAQVGCCCQKMSCSEFACSPSLTTRKSKQPVSSHGAFIFFSQIGSTCICMAIGHVNSHSLWLLSMLVHGCVGVSGVRLLGICLFAGFLLSERCCDWWLMLCASSYLLWSYAQHFFCWTSCTCSRLRSGVLHVCCQQEGHTWLQCGYWDFFWIHIEEYNYDGWWFGFACTCSHNPALKRCGDCLLSREEMIPNLQPMDCRYCIPFTQEIIPAMWHSDGRVATPVDHMNFLIAWYCSFCASEPTQESSVDPSSPAGNTSSPSCLSVSSFLRATTVIHMTFSKVQVSNVFLWWLSGCNVCVLIAHGASVHWFSNIFLLCVLLTCSMLWVDYAVSWI